MRQASSPGISTLLGLLGIVLQDLDVLVGLDCSPITVIGVGTGNSCSATAVCCENNNVVSTLPSSRRSFNRMLIARPLGRPHLHWLRPCFPLSPQTRRKSTAQVGRGAPIVTLGYQFPVVVPAVESRRY